MRQPMPAIGFIIPYLLLTKELLAQGGGGKDI